MFKFLSLILTVLGLAACAQKSMNASSAYTGLGRESIAADDLKKYAPKAIDAKLERDIRRMLDISSPGLGLLHPNKKQLFFSWKITGVYQVWTIDQERRFPILLTGGKDSTRLLDITPDGKWLLVSQDKDGQENPGVFLLSLDGAQQVPVFVKEKVRTSLAYVSDDSQFVYYSANDEKPEMFTFYKYSIKTGEREKIFAQEGAGIWSLADHTQDGRWLMAQYLSNSHVEYFEFNLKSKKLTPLFGQGENEDYTAVYAKNEKDILVVTSKFNDFKRLYLFTEKSKDKKWEEIFAVKDGDITGLELDHKRQRILVSTNEQAYAKVYALSATTYKKQSLPNFKGADHVFAGSTTRDGQVTMFSVSTPQSPRMSYSYNWSTKKLFQWVYPSAPGVDLKKFVPAKLEFYPAQDGTKIPMFVRRPPQCEKELCPVIVHFHGGPEGQSNPGFSTWSQIYVDNGFIFVDPNVRGSDGYGKTWLHADDQSKRLKVITDIQDCATYIKANWKKDGKSPLVGVMGGSYGGYATLYAMTKFAGTYDAGVSNVGMSNLVTFLQNTASYRRGLRMAEYGDLEKDRDALIELSPITHIDKVKSPLMIIQGANDPRVPAGEALQIQKTLEKKNIPSSLVLFADEGHGAEKRENQVLQIGHILEFFKRHLQSPDSGK